MRQLLIRLDDIAPTMNWEYFERLEALFAQYHICPIIGVVPDCRDPKLSVQDAKEDFWERMRALQDKGWTIAQHGWQHSYVTSDSGILGINAFSEFAGVSFREQYRKLKKGQEILHKNGICATMFMAPGHTYDKNTLKALKKLGFTSVTDGYCNRPYRRSGLVFLPCMISSPKVPKAFDTLCLHANEMTQEDFERLKEFVRQYPDMIADARMYGSADAANQNGGLAQSDLPKRKRFKIVSYYPGMWLQEKGNLFKRKLKSFAAQNTLVQDFLSKTDSPSSFTRKRKRIMGLPMLSLRLLFHKGNS